MKNLAILFVLCFAITLTGCSKEEPATIQKPEVQPAPQAAPITKTAVEEAKQVAAQVGEKVEQVAQQVEEKAVAAVEQVKASLISGQTIYMKACLACHKTGITGAPKVGDKGVWAPLISEGRDEMVKNAIEGIGRMPAKGGSSNLTDKEVEAAVDYMIEQSR